jgi:hypothetical protein
MTFFSMTQRLFIWMVPRVPDGEESLAVARHMRIDLFAHFTTQEFRQAYLSVPLGAKGRRLDSLAIRTFVQAQRTTDIDVLWDMEQRLTVLDRHGIDLQVLTLCFPMVGGLEPEEELRLARLANDGLAEIVQRYPHRFLGVATLPFSSPAEAAGTRCQKSSTLVVTNVGRCARRSKVGIASSLIIVSGRKTVTEITRPRYHAAIASMMLRCRMFSSKTIIATVLRRLWKSQAPL